MVRPRRSWKIEGDSRQKLLQVGLELFSKKGLDGVSIRDLAVAAGVNVSMISYYFEGKEGLYKSVIKEHAEMAQVRIEHLLADLEKEKFDQESFARFMRLFIGSLVEFKSHSPEMTRLMMREIVEGLPHAREIYDGLFAHLAEQIMDVLCRAQKAGFFRRDINTQTLLFSLVHSVDCHSLASSCQTVFTRKGLQIPGQEQQLAEQMYRLFIEGAIR